MRTDSEFCKEVMGHKKELIQKMKDGEIHVDVQARPKQSGP
jgi:hypothetical protein